MKEIGKKTRVINTKGLSHLYKDNRGVSKIIEDVPTESIELALICN